MLPAAVVVAAVFVISYVTVVPASSLFAANAAATAASTFAFTSLSLLTSVIDSSVSFTTFSISATFSASVFGLAASPPGIEPPPTKPSSPSALIPINTLKVSVAPAAKVRLFQCHVIPESPSYGFPFVLLK